MRLSFPGRPTAVLLLSLVVGACATKSDVQDLRAGLRADIQQVQATQDSLTSEIASMRSQLDRMEERQKSLILGRSSDLERHLEQLRTQVSQLTALVGQTQQRVESSLARRSATTPPDTGAGADTSAAGTGGAGGDPAALYEAALEQFRREAYETARGALEDFLSTYPDHRLAPDARFYLGRTREETGQVDQAVQTFQRVVELNPNSNRAPSALYRLGTIHLDRGEVEEARRFFQQIIRGYPDSPEAQPATDRLEEIGGS